MKNFVTGYNYQDEHNHFTVFLKTTGISPNDMQQVVLCYMVPTASNVTMLWVTGSISSRPLSMDSILTGSHIFLALCQTKSR